MSSKPALGLARSYLFAPAHRERYLEKLPSSGADAVVLDLEDAVPAHQKAKARRDLGAFLERAVGGPFCFVRINPPSAGFLEEDLEAAVRPGVAGIRLPKVEDGDAVASVSEAVGRWEARRHLPEGSLALDLTVETARGVGAVRQLTASSSRIRALVFGEADFLADIGARSTPSGESSLHARAEVVLAARLAGLMAPIEGAFPKLNDPEGLKARATRARDLGFFGMSAIHPDQVQLIHEAFTPTEEELAQCTAVVQALREAEAQGVGAVRLRDGTMVDPPIARRAEAVLALVRALREDAP